MKIKSIMYAIGYGKSLCALRRSEGARRVKQAIVMSEDRKRLRQAQKSLEFPFRYGSSAKKLESFICEEEADLILAMDKMRDKVYTSFHVPKTRQQSACHAFKVIYGKRSVNNVQ